MKRIMICLSLLLTLVLLIAGTNYSFAEGDEAVLTLMVYITGSDLESMGGAATGDITEMMRSGFDPEKVNIVLCTGGAKTWRGGFPNDQICFYRVAGRRPELLESLDLTSMGDPSTLSNFMNYSYEHFPAGQYALILWDHGGGPMNGVCFDELFSNNRSNDSLDLSELQSALHNSPFRENMKLEWIGFDACLMSSIETAYICSPYAKYMIASQETEPGTGWNYNFLSHASDGLSGDEIGRIIIDNYTEVANASDLMLTLSCIDLARIAEVEASMNDLFASLDDMLSPDHFSDISNGRRDAKSFGRASTGSEYDLVDLYSLSEQYSGVSSEKVDELQKALEEAIVYSSGNQENSHGLSVYYPYYNKDYYQASWKETYGAWGFADQYYDFMIDYADMWLGDPLADWSDVRVAALPPLPEGQELTTTLSKEQTDNYAFAQLFVVSETPFSDPYYYKIDEVDDVILSDDGVLHANYNYKALYVLDEFGNPLSDAIPYRIVDDMYLIRANLSDKTWDMWWDERFPGDFVVNEDATMDVRKAYLQCKLNEASGELDIVGVIDMREELGEGSNRMLAEGDGLYTGKQSIALDSEGFNWIWFLRYPREIQYNSDGSLLAFPDWRDPNTDGRISVEWDDIDNSKAWTLKFCEKQYTGLNLFAQYVIHDTQGNLAASNLIPVANPNLIHLPIDKETFSADGLSVTLNGIDAATSSFDDGLFLRLDIQDASTNVDVRDISVKNILFGKCLINSTYLLHQTVDADGNVGYVLNIPSKDMPEQLENVVEGISFDLYFQNDSGDEKKRISVVTEQVIDISSVHTQSSDQSTIAEAIVDGVQYKAVGLSINDSEELVLTLIVCNNTQRDLDCNWKSGILINGCEWSDSAYAKELTLPASCWTLENVTISQVSMLEESSFNRYSLPRYNFFQHWGINAVTSIDLIDRQDRIVHFELDTPFEYSKSEEFVEANKADNEIMIFESAEMIARIRDIIPRDDSVLLVVDIANLTNESMKITPQDAFINGQEISSRMGDVSGFTFSSVEIGAGFRKDIVWEMELAELGDINEELESISLCFEYQSVDDETKRYCTPAIIDFVTPLSVDKIDWLELGSDSIVVQVSHLLENESVDPVSIIALSMDSLTDSKNRVTTLGIKLSPDESDKFDHAEVVLLASRDNMQYFGNIWTPVEADNDGLLTCSFNGLMISMDHATYPMAQHIKAVEGGYEYDLRNISVSTIDRFGFSVSIEQLIVFLGSESKDSKIRLIALSRPIGKAERILRQEYMTIVYRYANGEGSVLERADTLTGETGDATDGKLSLKICPAEDLNPYVVFCITNKDGSSYTKGAYYSELVKATMIIE